jgi:hypothetical protein
MLSLFGKSLSLPPVATDEELISRSRIVEAAWRIEAR